MPEPASQTTLEPGAIVAGKFRVLRLLGVGGMGAVYEVEHELTKHRRALKLLFPRDGEKSTVVERFLREASAAGRIANAHIAETFDAGTVETGEAYLVMELLEGETLDRMNHRRGRLDAPELSSLIRQTCIGIQAAHDAGIVHRDLKPENLFVTLRDGRPFVKILDFGISKFDERRTGVIGVTAEGAVMGTPFYMSPEQVTGDASIDARTDVYSLGVILYECAAGRRPYDAETLSHLAVKIHEGKAVPLSEHRADLPAGFSDVVARAMAADRDDRYATARELSEALAPFANDASDEAFRATARSEAPKVVIRTSSAPPSSTLPGPGGVGAPRLHESVGFASATTTPHAVTAPRAPSKRIAPLVVGGLVVVALASYALRPRAAAPSIASSASSPVVAAPPPASGSTADPPPTSSDPVVSSVPSAVAATSAAPHPKSATAVTASTKPVAAPSSSTQRTRVDQKGLAGENPFR
jgi:serine/threonine-protein kinase